MLKICRQAFSKAPPRQQRLRMGKKQSNSDKGDFGDTQDVHSKQMQKAMIFEQDAELDDKPITIEYMTRLTRMQNAKQMDLNTLGQVRYEDMATFGNIPRLSHGLEKALKGGIIEGHCGVDPIYQPEQVHMSRMDTYRPPSKDTNLISLAKKNNLKYVMSTSTISAALSQMYFLFGNFRSPTFDGISPESFLNEPMKYMISLRKPVTCTVTKLGDNLYGMDSDKGPLVSVEKILMELGKVLENQLTLTNEDFERKFVVGKEGGEGPEFTPIPEHHRYIFVNNELCLRSQIDCMSYDQNGKPFVFEIKTRALSPIRYDLPQYRNYLDYELRQKLGQYESFERQYYDLIRGGFLRYAFQLKIGSMNGAFIAYHNTQKIFGYEYVRQQEIMKRIFGSELNSDVAFLVGSKMITTILDFLIKTIKEPYHHLRVGYYATTLGRSMLVFAELCEQQDPPQIPLTDQIKDEFDYYTKVRKFKNKVYKFQFDFYTFVNGTHQFHNLILQPSDVLSMYYLVTPRGSPTFQDYMDFLHEAFKFENTNFDMMYTGAWIRIRTYSKSKSNRLMSS